MLDRIREKFPHINLLLGLLAFMGAAVPGRCQCNPPPGMIAWWSGDGTFADRLGVAPMQAEGPVGFGPGFIGLAFDFDGSQKFLSTPDRPALRPESVTIEAWVFFNAFTGIRVILSKAAGPATSESYVLYAFGPEIHAGIGGPESYGNELTWSGPVTADAWHHLAYTYDGATREQVLYVDGQMRAAGRNIRTIGYDDHPVTLGGEYENNQPAYFLNGRIDEISFYGRALRPREILAIYKSGVAGKCQGLAPRTVAEAVRALEIAGGLRTASPDDLMSLQEEGLADLPWRVDLRDALRIARKAVAFDPGP